MKIDTHLSDHCITEQGPNKNTTGTTNPITIMNQMAIIDKLELTTVEIILTIQIISKTGIEIQQIKLQQNPIIKEDQSNKEMNIISLSLSEILRCLGNRFPIITACIHKVSKKCNNPHSNSNNHSKDHNNNLNCCNSNLNNQSNSNKIFLAKIKDSQVNFSSNAHHSNNHHLNSNNNYSNSKGLHSNNNLSSNNHHHSSNNSNNQLKDHNSNNHHHHHYSSSNKQFKGRNSSNNSKGLDSNKKGRRKILQRNHQGYSP